MTKRDAAMRGLLRLLAGDDVLDFNPNSAEYKTLFETLQSQLSNDWMDPVYRHLIDQKKTNRLTDKKRRAWQGVGSGSSPYVDIIEEGKQLLKDNAHIKHSDRTGHVIAEFACAAYAVNAVKGERRQVYGHAKASFDCVVNVIVPMAMKRNRFVDVSNLQEGLESALYAVAGVIGWKDEEDVWAVCRCMDAIDESQGMWKVRTTATSRTQLLKMTDTVRRAALFHMCTDNCEVNTKTKDVNHECSVFEGGVYRAARRSEGYPPRMA